MPQILIVEDDPLVLAALRQMLERGGHRVALASNGTEALQAIQEEMPDLVITDILMPEKDGLEVIIELRKQHADLPVIAISGGGSVVPGRYLEIARELGAACTFSKPFDRKRLLQAVWDVLDGREVAQDGDVPT